MKKRIAIFILILAILMAFVIIAMPKLARADALRVQTWAQVVERAKDRINEIAEKKYPEDWKYTENVQLSAVQIVSLNEKIEEMGKRFDSIEKKSSAIEAENATLKKRLQEIERQKSSSVSTGITTTDSSIERRVKILERAVSMNEVGIGSIYAYVNQQMSKNDLKIW